jgi:hypothetical protein
MIADEILDNSFDERKGTVGFLDCEGTLHSTYSIGRGVDVQGAATDHTSQKGGRWERCSEGSVVSCYTTA